MGGGDGSETQSKHSEKQSSPELELLERASFGEAHGHPWQSFLGQREMRVSWRSGVQGRMRPEIRGSRLESSENPRRRSLKGSLSRRSSEEFRGVQRCLVCHVSSIGEAQKQGQDTSPGPRWFWTWSLMFLLCFQT